MQRLCHYGMCYFFLQSSAEIRESLIMGKPFFCISLFSKSDVSCLGRELGERWESDILKLALWLCFTKSPRRIKDRTSSSFGWPPSWHAETLSKTKRARQATNAFSATLHSLHNFWQKPWRRSWIRETESFCCVGMFHPLACFVERGWPNVGRGAWRVF